MGELWTLIGPINGRHDIKIRAVVPYRCNCTILTLTEAPGEEDGSLLLGA